jgi:hypothetical protein
LRGHDAVLLESKSPLTADRDAHMSLFFSGVALSLVLLALAGWSIAFLPPLHPAQLWAVPWSVAVNLYSLRLLPFRSLSWTTTIIVAAAAFAFSLFALVGERFLERRLEWPQESKLKYRTIRPAALAVVVLTSVGVLAFVVSAAILYGLSDTLTASFHLRTEIGLGGLSIQIKYVYAALAAVGLCCIAAGLAPSPRLRRLWLTTAIASGASIYFATGRATVLSALIIGLVAYFISRGQVLERRRLLIGIGVVMGMALGIFLAGGQLIGKTYANSADLQAVPSLFARHSSVSVFALPYKYVTAPVAALDIQVRSASVWGDANGCAEGAEFCKGLRLIEPRVRPVPRIRPFTAPPLPWNTYTGLDLPLLDGGKVLAVPIVAILGFLCGILWAQSRRGNVLVIFVYSIEAAAIVGSPAVFLFTAPHVLGALLIGAVAILMASGTPARIVNRLAREPP